MVPFLRRIPLFLPLLVAAAALHAQSPDTGAPPPAVLQEKVREWVRVKRLVSEEASGWEAEKESLARLNDIRREEIAKLDELIAAAGGRLGDAEKELAGLREEKVALSGQRKALEDRITGLEATLRDRLSRFPAPLRKKIAESAERLENPAPDAPLQNRWRDVLFILGEASRFDRTLTLDQEVREFGEEKVEVDVLYLGLSQAWYADRKGRHAGTGIPAADGWEWTEQPSLHARVRNAIAIQRKETIPGFVSLPVTGAARP